MFLIELLRMPSNWGDAEGAEHLLQQMSQANLVPDEISHSSVIDAHAKQGNAEGLGMGCNR